MLSMWPITTNQYRIKSEASTNTEKLLGISHNWSKNFKHTHINMQTVWDKTNTYEEIKLLMAISQAEGKVKLIR